MRALNRTGRTAFDKSSESPYMGDPLLLYFYTFMPAGLFRDRNRTQHY